MRTKEEILSLIEEEDVEFIRLQFTDMFGNLKNIAVTPGQLSRVFGNKFSVKDSVLFDDKYSEGEDVYLHPDLDTFVILPWRPQQGKVGKFLCDVKLQDGSPYEMSSRTILKNVLEKAAKNGYSFYVDPETEFFLFEMDENGVATTRTHETAGYMDVGPIDFGENARRDMVLMLEEMGFEVESSHHEKAPGQHEIAFKEDSALKIADSLMTFKFAVRSIAKRFGQYATFMPKPITGAAGSGMHFNISVYKNDRNILGGNEISEDALHFIGGIMAHAKGICAVTNPIVNSYKRIISGFDAPKDIVWSTTGMNSLIRLRKSFDENKVELRFPDPSTNPYLALALCISAGMKGIECGINPGKDASLGNEAHESLPDNLKEAVLELRKDDFLTDILGAKFASVYTDAKLNEWYEYMYEVSDWEKSKYLTRM